MRFIIAAFIVLKSASGFSQKADFFVTEKVYKFPKTQEGPTISHSFVVVNRGTDTLKISDYKVSCSCTKVNFPRVIAPGASDSITITFDTKGKYYQQDRTVLLFTNTKKEVEELRFKVFVIPNEEKE